MLVWLHVGVSEHMDTAVLLLSAAWFVAHVQQTNIDDV